MANIYAGQFKKPVRRADPGDGRYFLDEQLRKIHRRGPTAPDTLAKRAAPDAADDAAIRNIAKTSAQLRFESNADAALSTIRKCLSSPSGSGLLLPETEVRKVRDVGSVHVSPKAIERMLQRRTNLRKDARTPALIDGLPGQSSNAFDPGAPASRVGADPSDVAGYSTGALPAGGVSRPYGASAAAVTSGRAGPEDSDLGGKRKKRRKHHARDDSSASVDTDIDDDDADDDMDDDDDDDDDSADFALKAIKRAHRAGPRRGW